MLALNSLRNTFIKKQCICQCFSQFSINYQISPIEIASNEIDNRSRTSNILVNVPKPMYLQTTKRFKFNAKKVKAKKDEDSDDETDTWRADDFSVEKDSKVFNVKIGTMRSDRILKAGLRIARNKVETLFYESKLRINGKKILKKSVHVKEGDELDVVKGVSSSNPNHLIISRVEVLQVTAKEEDIHVTIRAYKTFLIDNYAEDPWKPEHKSADMA